jgi:hypothetical protein
MDDHDLITTMRESFTDVRSATPVDTIVSRSKAIRARRRRIPGAVAMTAVAAAAGTAVALIPSGPARPAPVATRTTAYVLSHLAQALDAMPADTVVATQQTAVRAGDPMDMWADGGNQSRLETLTPAGQPVIDNGISFTGSGAQVTRTITNVNYQNRTWWRAVDHPAGANSAPATVWTCGNAETDTINGNPHAMAAQLHTLESCGDLKIIGSGPDGGVPAVELSGDFTGGDTVTYWVNATTYLPFRFTSTFRSGHVFQENLQWLPPTAANLATLNVPVPAGFTQVPPPGN